MEQLSDIAAERAVLAGICQFGNDVYDDISSLISIKTFTFDSNQSWYKCLDYLLKEKQASVVDSPSLWSAANDLGLSHLVDKPDERTYLRGLLNFPIKKENAIRLAKKVAKLEIARNLKLELSIAQANLNNVTGDEPIDHILGMAENPIIEFTTQIGSTDGEGPKLIGSGVDDYIKFLVDNQRDMVGISTGYPEFDMAIGGGLRRKTVNMIGARPKTGKTMLADNMALHIAGSLNIPVLNLDTEMSQEDHWNRMIANLSDVEINEIESGKFGNNTLHSQKINLAVDKLRNMPYYYKSIAGQPFDETVATMRRWVTKTVGLEDSGQAKPCVIIYDYLKLMTTDGLQNMQEFQLLGFQMTGLHNFMVRYGVPCVAFIQLNRDGITKEDTDVASGSDRLVWLCSNFSLYKKKSPEEISEDMGEQKYTHKLVPLVCRHGGGLEDNDYINLCMSGKFGRIKEGRTKNSLFKEKKKGEFINDSENIPKESKQY